ncbi:urease accessory protein UreD [Pseudalkalibacillus decolorationis]|uniref:urease accessory protein UreD n=1 Tax=Pseudalkalibacillus decolorationis TaxID=163879 RepID=UPI0021480680|nr:urease accessory protein UreD [Pseudalkalibacillus decolorationis]
MEFQKKNGLTCLTDCFQQSPLKASRALYLDDKEKATVYLMESSGGLVAGDRNEYKVHLKKQANVCLLQQSATKVYPSLNELSSAQHVSVQLDGGARLEWMPEAIIPFKDAKFNGDTMIRMKRDSTLLWGEIISPGREKRNECFYYDEFRSSFQIWVEEECLAYDTLHLSPTRMPLQQIGLLEKSLYIGSLWFVSPEVQSISIRDLHDKFKISKDINASVTGLEGKGLHFRWLATDLWALKKEMNKIWNQLT